MIAPATASPTKLKLHADQQPIITRARRVPAVWLDDSPGVCGV